MHYVYLIENLINNKLYVGYTSNPKRRWKAHKDWTYSANKKKFPINKAILKYGIENFNMKIIEISHSKEIALNLEKYWIAKLKNSGYTLYNVTDGGEGVSGNLISLAKMGHSVSQETREKLRIANLGKKHSEETKKKISLASTGRFRKLTTEKYNEILKCLRNNETRAKIAKKFNISAPAISYIAKKNGFSIRNNKPEIDINKDYDLCSKIVKDIQLGITYNKIAQKYNLKKSSIIRIKNIFKIKSPKFKLNEIDVFKIKNLIKEGLSDLEIAKIFNVSKSTIKLIKYEINWKHIKIK